MIDIPTDQVSQDGFNQAIAKFISEAQSKLKSLDERVQTLEDTMQTVQTTLQNHEDRLTAGGL